MVGAKHKINTITIIIASFLSLGLSSSNGYHWIKLSDPGYEPSIVSVAVDTKDPSHIYFGTNKALYSYNMQVRTLKLLSKLGGEHTTVNEIHVSSDEPNHLLSATEAGLFHSKNKGKTWERLFYHSNELSRNCQSVEKIDTTIYLGTLKGLFYKEQSASEWARFKGELGQTSITHIEKIDKYIFITNHQAIFRIDKNKNYIKIFSLGITQRDNLNSQGIIRDLKGIDGVIIIGSTKGIFVSTDLGQSWQKITTENIALEYLTSLIPRRSHGSCNINSVSCISLVLATTRGAFLYENGRTTPLYKGLATNEINELALGLRGEVYAATNDGLYVQPLTEALPTYNVAKKNSKYDQVKIVFENEPDIQDVHQMAVNYAEVSPDKIKDWRRQAKLKAMLPSLSAGIDRVGSDRYHWDTGQSPDVLQEGQDYLDWDVSLSWDLSDLIWSTDQTTIDSRSKLMVELREDVLDQITRLYFERRRLQIELLAKNFDEASVFDKKMRIDELTALIDALTGGEFSRTIQSSKR